MMMMMMMCYIKAGYSDEFTVKQVTIQNVYNR